MTSLDFSKCKTVKDVEKVWKKNKKQIALVKKSFKKLKGE